MSPSSVVMSSPSCVSCWCMSNDPATAGPADNDRDGGYWGGGEKHTICKIRVSKQSVKTIRNLKRTFSYEESKLRHFFC